MPELTFTRLAGSAESLLRAVAEEAVRG